MRKIKKINIDELEINPFNKIGKDWMLITSKEKNKVNTMTASWGGFGVMWGKNIVNIVLRPSRYTKQFIDSSNEFSLSFYGEEYRKILAYLGKVSGRNEDKISNSKLTLKEIDNIPTFEEAKITITCKCIYKQQIEPENFIDKTLDEKWYPNKDYHTVYVAEIKGIYEHS